MTLLLVVTLICYVSVQLPGVRFVFRMYGRKIKEKIRAQINLLQARCVNLFVRLLISCTGAPTKLNCFTTLNAAWAVFNWNSSGCLCYTAVHEIHGLGPHSCIIAPFVTISVLIAGMSGSWYTRQSDQHDQQIYMIIRLVTQAQGHWYRKESRLVVFLIYGNWLFCCFGDDYTAATSVFTSASTSIRENKTHCSRSSFFVSRLSESTDSSSARGPTQHCLASWHRWGRCGHGGGWQGPRNCTDPWIRSPSVEDPTLPWMGILHGSRAISLHSPVRINSNDKFADSQG